MNILGMIMAGGTGTRLFPLTQDRAKPAVPFGGIYRLIDFVLSNFINSKIFSIYVLTQFKSQSLTEHIQAGWRLSNILHDHFILPVPAQKRTGESWYRGTADAIFQNLNLITDRGYDIVAIFGADHIYHMDIRQMIDFHIEKDADVTISAIPVPLKEARDMGVILVDENEQVVGFQEKPDKPEHIPGKPDEAFASMGNYLFNADFLTEILFSDAGKLDSSHDFGKDVLPQIYKDHSVFAYDFRSNVIPGSSESETGYWKDVGSIKSLWEAHMELINIHPVFNLYNKKWPIITSSYGLPPAKFVLDDDGSQGEAVNSLISEGTVITGGIVQSSIIGRQVSINGNANITNSLIMDRVTIGENCKINMTIIDKDVVVPPSTEIGCNPEEDKKRFHIDEESNIIVIPKGYQFI